MLNLSLIAGNKVELQLALRYLGKFLKAYTDISLDPIVTIIELV